MNITLALLLGQSIFNCFAAFPFEDLLDTVSMVVVARIDTTWTTMDTIRSQPKTYDYIAEHNHYHARLLEVYVRNDTQPVPKSPLHIIYEGITIYPDGSVEWISATPSFELNETFIAPIYEVLWFHSETETIYNVNMCWYYPIRNDSIHVLDKTPEWRHLSLNEALDSLSTHFIKAF